LGEIMAWVRSVGGFKQASALLDANRSELAHLREALDESLQSRGGRPGLGGMEHRPKIPMSTEDFDQLEVLAEALATPDKRPTATQVASQLLHDAIARASKSAAFASTRDTGRVVDRPRRCECPYCHERKHVVNGKLEEHAVNVVQIADDQQSTCTLTFRCPASGAAVSEWKDVGRG
jgi:hypothetical protein